MSNGVVSPKLSLLRCLIGGVFTLFLLLTFLHDSTAAVEENGYGIGAFTSDGCSLFPDGWWDQADLWCSCCFEHDIAYWQGGTEAQRLAADNALSTCVKRKTGNQPLADMMLNGVRFGGHPIFPNWYRWGYGWPYGRGYKPLNKLEQRYVKDQLASYHRQGRQYVCRTPPPKQ